LVGISAEGNPNTIFAIHDFNENLTWPGEVEGRRVVDEN
jgi:hypothetical protein